MKVEIGFEYWVELTQAEKDSQGLLEKKSIKEGASNLSLIDLLGSKKKAREFHKNIYLALLTTPKPLTVWIMTNWGKFLERWEYQTTWPASWEICMQVKKQHLELDMKQQTASKLGKKYIKAVYCHPAYLTFMQNT